jgi:hypothetical protein
MTPEQLSDIFLSIPPHEPLAVTLLRERRAATGDLFPSVEEKRTTVAKATIELEQMSKQSNTMCENLLNLSPVPVTHPDSETLIGGYCL